MKTPTKIFINENTDVTENLRQQFVRIRNDGEQIREAIVASLVQRNFSMHTLVFVRTKVHCHRLNIVLGLLEIRSGELHGDMKQKDRLDSLRRFKKGDIDVLVCTDLASRGLDISNVENVLNLSLPSNYKNYVHRVGRTARAGKSGVAISLVSDNDRTLFTKIIKMNKKNKKALALENRTVPSEVLEEYLETCKEFETDVRGILKQEAFEKTLQFAEKDLMKAERRLDTRTKQAMGKEKEGDAQKRGWFQKHHDRSAKDQDKHAWMKGGKKKWIGPGEGKNGKAGAKAGRNGGKQGGSFKRDLSDTSKKSVKGMRSEAGIKRNDKRR